MLHEMSKFSIVIWMDLDKILMESDVAGLKTAKGR